MTILNQIRKNKLILIALSVILILGFLFNFDQFAIFLKPNPNVYGSVNNHNILKKEFNILKSLLKNKIQHNLLEEITWKFLIKYILINNQFNKSGLQITKNNFWIFTQYSPLLIKQYNYVNNEFFNPTKLKQEIEKIKIKSKNNSNYKLLYNNWLQEKKIIEYDIKKQLYFSTLFNGLLNNTNDIKFFKTEQNKYAAIEFIFINYENYNNKYKIKITNNELKNYINTHPKKFIKDSSIELTYVIFPNISSYQDDSITYKEIQTYKNGGIITDLQGKFIDSVNSIKNINNNEIESYINNYSDRKINIQDCIINQYPNHIQKWLKYAKIGEVYGPYSINNAYIISKLINIKKTDSIESRHILISYQDKSTKYKKNQQQAKQLANNLFTIICKDINNFDKLIHLSDDINTINKNGYLGWETIDNKNLDKDIKTFFKKNNKGKIGLIETKSGYHIIHILNKKIGSISYRLANLIKDRQPSEETSKRIEKKAFNFFKNIKNKTKKTFKIIATKKQYKIYNTNNIQRYILNINNINNYNNEEILQWAFNPTRKIGDTNIFISSNQDYIVIMINKIYPQGLATPQMVRHKIEKIIRNKKIANLLSKTINNSQKSLNELAKDFNIKKHFSIINFQNPIINNKLEPNIAAVALGIKPNHVSKAIEGENGIFVITTKKIFNNKKNINLKKFKEKIIKNQQFGEYRILLELEQKAKIKDFRSKINNN